jgi:hypothetical protein
MDGRVAKVLALTNMYRGKQINLLALTNDQRALNHHIERLAKGEKTQQPSGGGGVPSRETQIAHDARALAENLGAKAVLQRALAARGHAASARPAAAAAVEAVAPLIDGATLVRAAGNALLKSDLLSCAMLLRVIVHKASLVVLGAAVPLSEDFGNLGAILDAEERRDFDEVYQLFTLAAGSDATVYWYEGGIASGAAATPLAGGGGIPLAAAGGGGGDPPPADDADPVPISDDNLVVWGSDDLVGAEREKHEVLERFIYPLVFRRLLKSESALLLYGPPGTGKTQIAKAILTLFRNTFVTADDQQAINIFASNGSDLKGKYVGETEQKIHARYDALEKYAVAKNNDNAISLLFLDEVEVLGGDRLKDDSGNMAHSVNALLQALQGVVGRPHVITIAATNLPWSLDSAFDRRFTTQILVDSPGFHARLQLILATLKKRIFAHSQRFAVIMKKVYKERTPEEQQFVDAETASFKQGYREFDSNVSWFKMAVRLAYALGWTEGARAALLNKFAVQRGLATGIATTVASLPPEIPQAIDSFIAQGEHDHLWVYSLTSLTEHPQYASYIEKFSSEDQGKLTQVHYEKSGEKTEQTPEMRSGKSKEVLQEGATAEEVELSTPRTTFGAVNSEIVVFLNKAVNDFAMAMLKISQPGAAVTGCVMLPTKDSELRCATNAADYVLPWDTYNVGAGVSKTICPEFVTALAQAYRARKPTLRSEEYKNLVYFKITNQKPLPEVS